MAHAFLLFCPGDPAAAVRTYSLVRQYWTAQSALWLFCAQPTTVSLPALFDDPVLVGWAVHRTVSLGHAVLGALRTAIDRAAAEGIATVSLLWPDAIPTQRAGFYAFLARFAQTDAPFTFAAVSPKSVVPDLHALHINVAAFCRRPYWPLAGGGDSTPRYGVSDNLFFQLMQAKHFPWRSEGYRLSSICFAGDGGEGHDRTRTFRFDRFFPESTVIVTRDENFWGDYAAFFRD